MSSVSRSSWTTTMEAIHVVRFRCSLETVLEESESESTLDVHLAPRRLLRSYRGRKLIGTTLRIAYRASRTSGSTTLPSTSRNGTPRTPAFQLPVGRHRPTLQTYDAQLRNAQEISSKRSTSSICSGYTSLFSCQFLHPSSCPLPLPPSSSTSRMSAIQTLEDAKDFDTKNEHPVTLWTLFVITALGYFLFFLLFVVCLLWLFGGLLCGREEVIEDEQD